jgi:hypothetical protein
MIEIAISCGEKKTKKKKDLIRWRNYQFQN